MGQLVGIFTKRMGLARQQTNYSGYKGVEVESSFILLLNRPFGRYCKDFFQLMTK